MNGLTPALEAAQQSPSARYGLSGRVAARSTAWNGGGDAWEEVDAFPVGLSGWNDQTIATDSAAGSAGVLRLFLSWWEGTLACQYVPATNLGESASWTAPAIVTVATFGATGDVYTPKPALLYENDRWHAFYRLPAGPILHRSSGDNGATWSAAGTVYAGADVLGDLFALYLAATDLHVLQFSTESIGIHPRGASRMDHTGAWSLWPVHPAEEGWLPAGLLAAGPLGVQQILLARRANPFVHLLGRMGATLNADGTLAARDTAVTTLWSVTGDGALRPRMPSAGRALGGEMVTLHDSGATRAYLCAAGLVGAGGRMEEPLVLSDTPLPTHPLEGHFAPLDGGLESWLVGLTRVFRTVHRSDDVTVDETDIIRYRLDVDWTHGGRLLLDLRPGSLAAGVLPGHGLWLTRSCLAGDPASGGAVTLGLRVERVERHASFTRLLARDALGILAATVARRPLHFDPSAFTLAQAVEALAAWAGLRIQMESIPAGTVPAFQWQGGEDGLTALRRLLKGHALHLRSRVAASDEPPALWVGLAESTPVAAFGAFGQAGVHPLIRRAAVSDAGAARLAVVQGWAVRNTPSLGEDWALALVQREGARPSPAVRPRPAVLLNRNLAADEQGAVATALRSALEAGLNAGWIDLQAHLALEPLDRIVVEGEDAHVAGIREEWRRGRLVQRVDLAA